MAETDRITAIFGLNLAAFCICVVSRAPASAGLCLTIFPFGDSRIYRRSVELTSDSLVHNTIPFSIAQYNGLTLATRHADCGLVVAWFHVRAYNYLLDLRRPP